MQWKLLILLAGLLCACDQTPKQKHATMPPGFALVCDKSQKNFAAKRLENDQLVICYGEKPCDSKQAAIERAWGQYTFEAEHPYIRMPRATEAGFEECP